MSDRTDPRFLIFHGSQDRIVSPSQTLRCTRRCALPASRAPAMCSTARAMAISPSAGDAAAGLPWSSNEAMDIIVRFLRDSK